MESADLPVFFGIGLDNGAQTLVTNGWNTAQVYAQTAFSDATGFLDKLSAASAKLADIGDIPFQVGPATVVLTPYISPTPPTSDDLTTSFPVAPNAPTLGTVTLPTFSEAPVFDAVAPAVNTDIAVPAPLSASLPAEPSLSVVIFPDDISVTIPDVPTLLSINLPTVPTLDIPLFTASLGAIPDAPDVTFEFTEPEYVSSLKTALLAKLTSWVNGTSTGLDPAVEQAIYERARAREIANAERAVDDAMRLFGARGFDLPSGAMVDAVLAAQQQEIDKSSSLSRDIMVKQAELEQSNAHFAIEQAVRYDGILIDYANKVAQRAFEAAKFLVESAISIFNAKVALFNATVQGFVAEATVFRARLEAALAQLEIYKTELEGQKLIGELNLQSVQIYKTEVEAVNTVVDVYKARLEAVKTRIDADMRQIEVFRALVSAYDSQVKAKASEYDAYATQVKAEMTKVEVFGAQANAYDSVVKGFAAAVDAKKTVAELEMEINQKMPLEVYKDLLTAYSTQVGAESTRIKALSDVFSAKTQLFSSEVTGEASRVDSETKAYVAQINGLVAEASLGVDAAKAKLQATITAATAMIEAIRGGATAAAQLAASALSAVNLSGSISSSISGSSSVNANMNSGAQNTSIYEEIHNVKS